jgi:hypothetical protein
MEVSAELERRLLAEEWQAIILSVRMRTALTIDRHRDAAERIGLIHPTNTVSSPEHHSLIKLRWKTVRLRQCRRSVLADPPQLCQYRGPNLSAASCLYHEAN